MVRIACPAAPESPESTSFSDTNSNVSDYSQRQQGLEDLEAEWWSMKAAHSSSCALKGNMLGTACIASTMMVVPKIVGSGSVNQCHLQSVAVAF